jgi:hypothetical protein
MADRLATVIGRGFRQWSVLLSAGWAAAMVARSIGNHGTVLGGSGGGAGR